MALISTTKPEEPPRKRKKGPKGPNPLSVKKKKVTPESASAAKKNKGKEKAKTAQGPTVFGEVKVGEKRKREQVDPRTEELHHDHDDQTGSKSLAGGHKRKRRRKAA
jgi:U3 small nucleolar RNA-associated protein 23